MLHSMIVGQGVNTDSCTDTYIIPEGYDYVLVAFGSANAHLSLGIILTKVHINFALSTFNLNADAKIESCYFTQDVDTRTITMTVTNRNGYQKIYGNNVKFFGIK